MSLSDEVDLEDYVCQPDKISAAEVSNIALTLLWFCVFSYFGDWQDTECLGHLQLQIAAICQEAGLHAIRNNRYVLLPKDFEKGYRSNVKKSLTQIWNSTSDSQESVDQ